MFFTWGFIYAGLQTTSGKAVDTLGNSLGSLGMGSLVTVIGVMMVLSALVNEFGLGTWMIAGAIQVFFGIMLLLAGVLGLKGRSTYREWRAAVRN